jgi:hypothetical protein
LVVFAPRRNFGHTTPTKWNNMRVFALEEAAEQIKASKRWLADQARAGIIPARKIGGKWVFVEADLVEILERFRNDRLQSKTSTDDLGLTAGSSRRRSDNDSLRLQAEREAVERANRKRDDQVYDAPVSAVSSTTTSWGHVE